MTYRGIAIASIVLSALFLGALLTVYVRYDSLLALSQAADSFVDVFASSAILYSMYVSAQPADAGHPKGHYRAEPIAALVAAVLAGVLAFEVIRSAVEALLSGAQPRMHWTVAAAFGFKLGGKAVVYAVSRRGARVRRSPALSALAVDARNDVLVGLVAVVGFFAARYGWSGWDAWLAIPIGVWIGAAGLSLGVENIRLLMGEAAPRSRQLELRGLVEGMEEVRASHEWTVRHEGTGLDVSVSIVLDEHLPLRMAHDIAVSVEERLTAEPDVVHATVHVDVDPPEG